jgi:hypothetical protein
MIVNRGSSIVWPRRGERQQVDLMPLRQPSDQVEVADGRPL